MPVSNASSNSRAHISRSSSDRRLPRLACGIDAAASIMRFGWSGASTSTTRRSTRGGLPLLHGSMGISSSSSAWSSTIFRLVKWSFSVLDASRAPSVRVHRRMCSAVRSFSRTWPMTSQHARILPALVRYVVGLTRVL